MEKINDKHNRVMSILFLALVFLVAIYPLCQSGLIAHENQDLPYHLLRIEGIKEELALGHFPARIHGFVLNGYGYANSLCYPDILLYFPALLRLAGVGMEWAYKLFVLAVTLGTLLSAYFCSKMMTKSRFAALIFTALFLLSQYRLSNVYLRAAVGEYCAYLFIPLVLAGIHDYFYQDFGHPWLIGLGFLGLLLTHSITFAIAAAVTLVIFVCSWKTVLQHKENLGKLMIAALVVLGLSSYYWAPFLEQLMSQRLLFHQPWALPSQWAIAPGTLLDYGYYAGLGLPLLVFLAFRLMLRENADEDKRKQADRWMLIGLILTLMATWLFPWQLLDYTPLRSIQFPWRLFALASAYLAMAIAAFAQLAFSEKAVKKALAVVLVGCIGCAVAYLYPLTNANLVMNKTYYAENGTFFIGAGEWLPEGVNTDNLHEPYTVRDEQNQALPLTEKRGTTVTFIVEGKSGYYDVPLLYYRGYTAVLEKENGQKELLPVESSPGHHLVRVYTADSGKVTVQYRGTWIQRISGWVSLATLLGYLIYALWRKRKKTG